MRSANYGQVLRLLLEPPAYQLGVDYDMHTLFIYGDVDEMPGGRPEDVAFGLLAAGGKILAAKTPADEFPVRGRLGRKGSKTLLSMLGEPESVEASAFLAQAQTRLAVERQSREGNVDDAAWHRAAGDLLQAHVPIGEKLRADLDYYLDKSFERARELRGQELPEYAAPEATAAIAFEQWATIVALTYVLGSDFMESDKTLDKMILPGTGWESFSTGSADQASRWLAAEKERQVYVQEAVDRGFI